MRARVKALGPVEWGWRAFALITGNRLVYPKEAFFARVGDEARHNVPGQCHDRSQRY